MRLFGAPALDRPVVQRNSMVLQLDRKPLPGRLVRSCKPSRIIRISLISQPAKK